MRTRVRTAVCRVQRLHFVKVCQHKRLRLQTLRCFWYRGHGFPGALLGIGLLSRRFASCTSLDRFDKVRLRGQGPSDAETLLFRYSCPIEEDVSWGFPSSCHRLCCCPRADKRTTKRFCTLAVFSPTGSCTDVEGPGPQGAIEIL
jgi:hypothetical protein